MKTKKITYISMLVCLSLILSYLEFLLPPIIPLPGIKLGLSNLCIIIAIYLFGYKEAILVAFCKIVLSGLLFTGITAIMYSLMGTILSLLVMIILKELNKNSIIGISLSGGIFHNLGQIIIATLILENTKMFYYLPILIISGLISGIFIGILAKLNVDFLKKIKF